MYRERAVAVLYSALLVVTTGCETASQPKDEAIVTGIQGKMFSEPALKASSITVSAKDGVVTLSGQLPDEAARQTAQKIASQATGVSKIIDQTTLASQKVAATQAPVVEQKPAAVAATKAALAKSPSAKKSASAARSEGLEDAPQPPVTSTDSLPPATPEATANPGPLATTALSAATVPAAPPAAPKPQPITVTVPEGSILTVRTIDPIDSSVNRTGQMFKASLDAPIVVDDRVVAPKDLNVTLKLVNASTAGRMSGRSELTVSLDNFVYQGKRYTVSSSDVQEKGGSRGKRSAAVIGGGAALGAIIGGIAGGGKGAAIGAAAGGGGGVAAQALTKGEQVKIPAETRLDFTLHSPIDVTFLPGRKSPRPNTEGVPPEGSTPTASPTPSGEVPAASSDQPPATANQPPNR